MRNEYNEAFVDLEKAEQVSADCLHDLAERLDQFVEPSSLIDNLQNIDTLVKQVIGAKRKEVGVQTEAEQYDRRRRPRNERSQLRGGGDRDQTPVQNINRPTV